MNYEAQTTEAEKRFQAAMEDDFNIPEALAVIFGSINEINPKIWELGKKSAKSIAKWIKEKLAIFGIELAMPKIPLKIKLFVRKRELFRGSQQFAQADALRKQIEALGYTIEDLPRGPFVWPTESYND